MKIICEIAFLLYDNIYCEMASHRHAYFIRKPQLLTIIMKKRWKEKKKQPEYLLCYWSSFTFHTDMGLSSNISYKLIDCVFFYLHNSWQCFYPFLFGRCP